LQYLLQQFVSDHANKRTDEWGGSAANRARFLLEILAALKAEFGDLKRVAVRLSPTTKYNDCLDSVRNSVFSLLFCICVSETFRLLKNRILLQHTQQLFDCCKSFFQTWRFWKSLRVVLT
jgi:hypothetical protein